MAIALVGMKNFIAPPRAMEQQSPQAHARPKSDADADEAAFFVSGVRH
jgi:hypothetical protein